MKFVLLLAAFAADPASAFTTGLTLATTTPPPSSLSSSRKSSLRLDAASVASDGVANGTDKKKIIVLGGDGFCGWPTSLYLSDQGHDVVIVDNLSRRNIDTELGCDSLTPIQPPGVSYKLRTLTCPSLILERSSLPPIRPAGRPWDNDDAVAFFFASFPFCFFEITPPRVRDGEDGMIVVLV